MRHEVMEFILASQSPRRQELIRLYDFPVRVQIADVDEESITDDDPKANVVGTARLKAEAVAANAGDDAIIIAADTVVALDGEMLGKPANDADALEMLRRLRGRTHQVYTGIALLNTATGQMVTGVSTTDVTMRNYDEREMRNYIASGDPFDKAGGYAIQNERFRPVARLKGCYTGVVGLPLCYLTNALKEMGIETKVPVARRSHHYLRCQTCMGMMDGLELGPG